MTQTIGHLGAILCAASPEFAADVERSLVARKPFSTSHVIGGYKVEFRCTSRGPGEVSYEYGLTIGGEGDLMVSGNRDGSVCREYVSLATPQGRDADRFHDVALEREGAAIGDLLPTKGILAPLGRLTIEDLSYDPPMDGSNLYVILISLPDVEG